MCGINTIAMQGQVSPSRSDTKGVRGHEPSRYPLCLSPAFLFCRRAQPQQGPRVAAAEEGVRGRRQGHAGVVGGKGQGTSLGAKRFSAAAVSAVC